MRLWEWPDGLIWKLTEKRTIASRQKRYNIFIKLVNPLPTEKILDVGVHSSIIRGFNFFEQWYSYPENITALTCDDLCKYENFTNAFPKVRLIQGDGRHLPFADNSFDIVFANAVVEHVGDYENQRKFVHELMRVAKRAFITTPNHFFPVDAHTLIPFAHYLPLKSRFWLYKKLGRSYYADINHLNLLTPQRFLSLFPRNVEVSLVKQRNFGLVSNLIAVVKKVSE